VISRSGYRFLEKIMLKPTLQSETMSCPVIIAAEIAIGEGA
jgi:hypothetical protein